MPSVLGVTRSYSSCFRIDGNLGLFPVLFPFSSFFTLEHCFPLELHVYYAIFHMTNRSFEPQKWGTEATAKSRRDPIIDKAIVPYSVVR